jgi:hypothetical protein
MARGSSTGSPDTLEALIDGILWLLQTPHPLV